MYNLEFVHHDHQNYLSGYLIVELPTNRILKNNNCKELMESNLEQMFVQKDHGVHRLSLNFHWYMVRTFQLGYHTRTFHFSMHPKEVST